MFLVLILRWALNEIGNVIMRTRQIKLYQYYFFDFTFSAEGIEVMMVSDINPIIKRF